MIYQCENCNKEYKTKDGLRIHINLKHSAVQSLKCAKCDKHFLHKYLLKNHLRQVHPSKLHSCTFCGSSFKSKYARDIHITSIHTGEKAFPCKICPSKFSTLAALRIHQLVHTDDQPHGCNLCSKHFKSSANLKKHVKFVHTKSETKRFTCTECNKAFFRKSDLTQHQNIHKNNGEGFPDCYFCHKKISDSSNLVRHLRLHTNEKPFSCKEKGCKYSSVHSSLLKRHQRRFHSSIATPNQVNVKIWTCYFCAKSYSDFRDFTTHMRRHTKEVPFKCNFCKKKYISQNSLKLHIASHTNEKPFSCSQCEKDFKTNGHLKNHMVTHTKEQRYFCNICGYGSYFKRSLSRHSLSCQDDDSK